MNSNALTGQLPGSWSSGFTQLQQMDLHGNSLSGSLPTAWGTASSLPQLQTLDLNNNQLSGAWLLVFCASYRGDLPSTSSNGV